MPTKGRINELPVIQANHSPGDAISLGYNVKKVTIRNQTRSTNTLFISWNMSGATINALAPGESASYYHDDIDLDDNALYISFDKTGSGGVGLVSIINDTKVAC